MPESAYKIMSKTANKRLAPVKWFLTAVHFLLNSDLNNGLDIMSKGSSFASRSCAL